MQNAIKNDETRKLIIKHYNNIINDEKNQYKKTNMTLALKLQSNKLNEREYFVVNDQKVKRKKKEGI